MNASVKNIMLDLETLSTMPNAMICSIGAVVFDQSGLGAEFYRRIKIDSCDQAGAHISPSTVMWWLRQSSEARDGFDTEKSSEFIPTLMDFSAFMQHYAPDANLWGNGADFDNVILASAYHRTGLVIPWGNYKSRCYRTLKSIAPKIKIDRSGIHHHALDDARSQAEHAIALLNHVGGW